MIVRYIVLCVTISLGVCCNGSGQARGAKRTVTLRGEVVKVIDGDTLVVNVNGREQQIDLAAIDAPELGQPFGDEAMAALSKMVIEKKIRFQVIHTKTAGIPASALGVRLQEKSEQFSAFVSIGAKSVNQELLRDGLAWHTQRALAKWEQTARRKKVGLWQDENPINPAEWRKQQAKVAAQKALEERMQEEASHFRPNGVNEIVKQEDGKTALYIYKRRSTPTRVSPRDLGDVVQRSINRAAYYDQRKRLAKLSGKYDEVIIMVY